MYRQGLFGLLPEHPMNVDDLEERARNAMPPSVWSYVAGGAGAGDERTQGADREAFAHWGLIPRMLAPQALRRVCPWLH